MSPSLPPRLPGATAVAVAALLLVAPVAHAEESGPPGAPGTSMAEPGPAAPTARPASEGRPRPGRPTGGQVVRPEEAGPAIGAENGGGDGGDGGTDSGSAAGGDGTGSGTGGHPPTSGTGTAAEHPAARPPSTPATPPAGSARPSPMTSSSAASDSAGTSASPSRVRPDRTAKPPEADGDEETVEEDHALPEPVAPIPDAPSTPRPPAPEAPRERGTAFVTNTSGRPVSVLTLGTGITLIGLGLGFLGVRLRR
ncbi:hypothetical protein [Streptomyces sp. NPDC059134]|uniref:hypothetical protein n=1 Tax=Streptomyces sp. NPDC059134 TaxID=3346738 RepID=UPI0036B0D525